MESTDQIRYTDETKMEDRPGDAERSSPEVTLDAVEYGARFQRHRETLELRMEYIYGLNNFLEEKDIFTEKELIQFTNESDLLKVNSKILDLLIEKNNLKNFEEFLEILGESWQTHFRRLIIQNGKFADNEQDQPLTESQLKHLRVNTRKIVENLQSLVDELPNCLRGNGCINEYHFQKILHNISSTNLDRARTMIFILKNRSLQHFNKFRENLKERKSPVHAFLNFEKPACIVTLDTNHDIIVTDILNVEGSSNVTKVSNNKKVSSEKVQISKDAFDLEDISNYKISSNAEDVSSGVHDSIEQNTSNIQASNVEDTSHAGGTSCDVSTSTVADVPSSDNASNIEDKLAISKASTDSVVPSFQAKKLIEKQVIESFSNSTSNIASVNDGEIVGMTIGNSIRVYIRCPTRESLIKLREAVKNGSMKSSLEMLYNDLLPENQQLRLKVKKVFMVDFKMQEFYQLCDINNIAITDNMLDHKLLRNGEDNISTVFGTNQEKFLSIKQQILLKAYFLRLTENIESAKPDSTVFNALLTVCHDWWKTLRLNHYKKTLKSTKTFKLKKRYRKKISSNLSELEKGIRECLPEFTDDEVVRLVSYLWSCGVLGLQDLQNLTAQEIVNSGCVTRIQAARLLDFFEETSEKYNMEKSIMSDLMKEYGELENIKTLKKNITGGSALAAGIAVGAAVGAIGGPVGSVIGAGVGAIIGGLGGLAVNRDTQQRLNHLKKLKETKIAELESKLAIIDRELT